jgi:hypothetical protein
MATVVGVVNQHIAGMGQFNAFGAADKQLNAQCFFQASHMRRQRWLCHVNLLGCFRKTAGFGNG